MEAIPMAKSELPMTSSTGFAAAKAHPGVALQRDGRLAKTGETGLSLRPAMEIEEESLVVDDRSGVTPAQMVETKLSRKLQETSLPVSHLQMRVLLRSR